MVAAQVCTFGRPLLGDTAGRSLQTEIVREESCQLRFDRGLAGHETHHGTRDV